MARKLHWLPAKDLTMMKLTMREGEGVIDLELEGELTGASTQELERVWQQARRRATPQPVRVDLSRVTYIGTMGKNLLWLMSRCGCELVAHGQRKIVVPEIAC